MKLLLIIGILFISIGCGKKHEAPVFSDSDVIRVIEKDDIDGFRQLVDNGLDISVPVGEDSFGAAPIHFAAMVNSVKIAGFLIENGVDVMKRTDYGVRPIDIAWEKEDWEVCKVLAVPDSPGLGGLEIPIEPLLEFLFPDPIEPLLEHPRSPIYVSINGRSATKNEVHILSLPSERVRSLALLEAGKRRPYYQASKGYGESITIEIQKIIGEDKVTYPYHFDQTFGAMTGGGSKGTIIWAYGYFIKGEVISIDH